MEQKTNINPAILQDMLASAANAAEKGQSQFFTPLDFGRWCAQSLPACRPAIVDLTCGNGQLLQACVPPEPAADTRTATPITCTLLGADIDPTRNADGVHASRIHYDLTLLYPLLTEVRWRADLFTLNPPWRLFWHRERLAQLAESACSAVSDAWEAEEESAPRGTIDSTIATLMIALDLSSHSGEGFLIANNNTLDRLLFNPGAPYKSLTRHIWARVIVPGNPMTGLDHCKWHDKSDATDATTEFRTGVLYFARDHTAGPTHYHYPEVPNRLQRLGSEITNLYHSQKECADVWNDVRDHVRELQDQRPLSHWNLWLGPDGRIRTQLSRFEDRSTKTDKTEAGRLFNLTGQSPMELVLQRAQRDELLHVTGDSRWKVDPALIDAVKNAIQQYHAARAPLYPLPEIQRLGYLDEQDTIQCKEDLIGDVFIQPEPTNDADDPDPKLIREHRVVFHAGQSYSLRTQTVQVTRKVEKPNSFTGQKDELEFTGQELAIFIADRVRSAPLNAAPAARAESDDLTEYCFMDQTIRGGNVKVNEARQQKGRRRNGMEGDAIPVDFTLQELARHFVIPEVPDVATNNPGQYRANLQTLEELEQLCNA